MRKLSVTSDVAHKVDELRCVAATSALTACAIGSAHELQMPNVLDVACVGCHRSARSRNSVESSRRATEAHGQCRNGRT